MSLQFVDALKDALSALRSPRLSPSEQFADWLPYSAYIAEEQLFVNRDGLGFVLEVLPQAGADEQDARVRGLAHDSLQKSRQSSSATASVGRV